MINRKDAGMTLLIDNLTNTEWLQTLAASNTEVYQQIADMVNVEGYPLGDLRDFIEDFGLSAFTDGHYHTWEKLEETYRHDAIEAWVEIAGIDAIGSMENYYIGQYHNEVEFAEEYFVGIMGYIELDRVMEMGIVIDWEGTWETNLRHDFYFEGGYVFSKNG